MSPLVPALQHFATHIKLRGDRLYAPRECRILAALSYSWQIALMRMISLTSGFFLGLAINLMPLAWAAGEAGGPELRSDWLARFQASVASGDCRAVRSLAHAAEASADASALFSLATIRERGGPCLARSDTEAVKLLRRAASLGLEASMLRLGYKYLHGDGILPDRDQARAWFRRAVIALAPLEPSKRRELIWMMFQNESIPSLLEQQLEWLDDIEAGGPEAILAFANQLRAEHTDFENEEVAEKLMTDLAIEGFVAAQYELGAWQAERAAAEGHACTPGALRYLLIAAENGHPLAQATVGRCYGREENAKALGYKYLLAARAAGVDVDQELANLEADLDASEIEWAHEEVRELISE